MILGLRTVIYPAPDLDAAREWYQRLVGEPPYFNEPYYVGFAVGGFELGLVPEGTPSLDGARAYWGVADIVAEQERIVALGAAVVEPVTDGDAANRAS